MLDLISRQDAQQKKNTENLEEQTHTPLQHIDARLRMLRQIDLDILAAESIEKIAQIALRHVRLLVPCVRASFVVFDYSTKEGVILAVSTQSQETMLGNGARIPFSSFSIIDHFQKFGMPSATAPVQPFINRAINQQEVHFRREGIEQIVQIPLVSKGELIGSLNLGAATADAIQTEHIEMVYEVANSLAVAVQQTLLHEKIQQQTQELQQRVEALQQAEREIEQERRLLALRVEQRTAELNHALDELARAARLKDEFLAMISHELRTPLNAMLTHTEVVQEGIYGPLNEKQQRSLNTIQDSGKHLLGIINNVLDMSKLQQGAIDLQMSLIDINTICNKSLRTVKEKAEKKGIEIALEIQTNSRFVQADEPRLIQVLTNLLDNAVKFTPDKGKVGLRVSEDPQQPMLHLVVWDTGIGIERENLDKLFKPFTQIDMRLNREYSGVGLGLVLVDQLVRLHGGRVEVASQIGVGSQFHIWLPLPQEVVSWQAQRSQQRSNSPTLSPPQSRIKPLVLVAEDNELNRQTLVDYLTFSGYLVIPTSNGQEAVEATQHHQPNLILMDMQMPVLDGFGAIQRLRKLGCKTPIIALTGLATDEDERTCLGVGATDYLSKPVHLKMLLTSIREHLQ